jgi:uncharacterized protein (DUF885 family)
MQRWGIATATVCLVSCVAPSGAKRGTEVAMHGPAIEGVNDHRLQRVLFEHWEDYLRRDPLRATRLGDHRFDAELPDRSIEARKKNDESSRKFLFAARAIPTDSLDAQDRITQALFMEEMEAEIESNACVFAEWTVSPGSGDDFSGNPVAELNQIAELHLVKTASDAANLVKRYRAAPALIKEEIRNLKEGASKGLYGNAESTKRAIAMVETQLKEPIDKWPMLEPAKKKHEGWKDKEREAFAHDLKKAVEAVRPEIQRWLETVKKEIAPKARDDSHSGLSALPIGKQCYRARVKRFTSLTLSAEELHKLGRAEIDRIDQEMQALGKKLFGLEELGRTLEKLRGDKSLFFKTDKEIEEKASAALKLAHERIKDWFGVLPKTDCVIARIPDYEAPFTTTAYYREPNPDGSKPGEYFVNVYQPSTRPRYEAEALAYHEAIPGHHLQIAIAQELKGLPAFRKYGDMTVFVEGWALYTERLADEMGMYSGDLDRLGMLSYEAWRAARLVVDTGLHAMGWSREAAKGFLTAHTALSAANIDNEIDRYVVWPGQALAYKTGQMEILRLREQAKSQLGSKFDIKSFHDAVLSKSAVSLPVLRAQIEAWIKDRS